MTRNPRLQPRIWDHGFLHLRSIRDALRNEGHAHRGPVLDVGCGGAPYRAFFNDAYLGIDLQPTGDAVRAVAHSENLPVRPGSVDLVVSTQHLEHAADPRRALAEFATALRPGGTLLLTTHGVWPYHPDPDDYWRWTEAGLALELRRQGFQIERTYRCGELCSAAVPLLGYPLVPALAKPSAALRSAARVVFGVLNCVALCGDLFLRLARVRHLASPCFVVVART